ncbi:hypothetical protein PV08_04829 [Exophiala spinifera]|uniref:Complex 1 LYR protein domain-containing protein n=1 Tax=Exophiala spinifera TaxID=91928 RepID=A0A0D2C1V6_9EURO|nr:uncharacterized protein PV08_04829 [Exophiala spinifera]KIW17634.1 hypothetical protein PV08_04829 [Exophiala spinifera]
MRYSGLQREVMKLYRQCLRAAGKKPEVRANSVAFSHRLIGLKSSKTHFRDAARREFRKHQKVDKKDFAAIEALLRMGSRKLELYSSPGVKDIH